MGRAKKSHLSSDEIKQQYFRSQNRNTLETVQREAPPLRPAHLTASANHIVIEAKKQLGRSENSEIAPQLNEDSLYELVQFLESSEGETLSERERTAAVATLSASLEHYDVLSPLIENPEVNDIIVASYNDISIQSGRKNVQTDLQFSDREAYLSFIENLLKRVGKSCTLATPVIDAAIDPHVRACVTHESFSPPTMGPTLTLRIARHKNISIEGLVQCELAPTAVLEYLSCLMTSGNTTMLLAGEVGTGKTTLLKALSRSVKPHEAILIIEDTHEIVLDRPFTRTLLTREANTEGAGRISPADAIRTGMRMAMNRIILGEMRDAESAESFVDVCASGHSGISTIHARNARDALGRLELFLSRAQPGVTLETIRKQVANAIDVVVFLDLDPVNLKRRIMNVIEVEQASDGAIQISPIFSYDSQNGQACWIRDSGISQFRDSLNEQGIFLDSPSTRYHIREE